MEYNLYKLLLKIHWVIKYFCGSQYFHLKVKILTLELLFQCPEITHSAIYNNVFLFYIIYNSSFNIAVNYYKGHHKI